MRAADGDFICKRAKGADSRPARGSPLMNSIHDPVNETGAAADTHGPHAGQPPIAFPSIFS